MPLLLKRIALAYFKTDLRIKAINIVAPMSYAPVHYKFFKRKILRSKQHASFSANMRNNLLLSKAFEGLSYFTWVVDKAIDEVLYLC